MLKYKNFKIKKKKNSNIYLDYIVKSDIELIRVWRNNQTDVLRQSDHINKNKQLRYFKNEVLSEKNKKRPNQILFSIKKCNLTIGYCGFVNISWINKRSEISFLLDNKLKKKPEYNYVMNKVFRELFIMGFKSLDMNKLFVETFTFRKKHIKSLEKIGMKKEGKLKKQYIKNKNFVDSVIHAKLR